MAVATSNITGAGDQTVIAAPAATVGPIELINLTVQNADTTQCTLALYDGASSEAIKVWEGPLAASGGGATIDMRQWDKSRRKRIGHFLRSGKALVGVVTTAGARNVYANIVYRLGSSNP